jgi:hypothetical protein
MIDEQQLRAIVREVIARKLGAASAVQPGGTALLPSRAGYEPCAAPTAHASHGMLRMVVATQPDGPCVIEPHVACDHCGYCKSLGH